MAESGQSAPKASDLYLGIVDLFAVILPGAIIVFALARGFDGVTKFASLERAEGWAVFLASSYIVGHVVSALGGLLLDKVYDTGFKVYKTHSSYFRVRIRARDVVKSMLAQFYSDRDNAMEWAGMIIRLNSSAASAEIDRLEADSKFFRSLTMVLILGWPIYVSINTSRHTALVRLVSTVSFVLVLVLRYYVGRKSALHENSDRVETEAPIQPPTANAQAQPTATSVQSPPSNAASFRDRGPVSRLGRFVRWVDERLSEDESQSIAEPTIAENSIPLQVRVAMDKDRWQRLADPCRKATLWVTGIWVALVILSGWLKAPVYAVPGAACAALAVFAAWRYMDLRLKRTRLTYAYLIALTIPSMEVEVSSNGDSSHKGEGGKA